MIYRNQKSVILGKQKPVKPVELYEIILAPIFFAAFTLLVIGILCL